KIENRRQCWCHGTIIGGAVGVAAKASRASHRQNPRPAATLAPLACWGDPQGCHFPFSPRPGLDAERRFYWRLSMKFLPKTGFVLIAAMFALSAHAQQLTGTLKKIKDTGTITLGTRESSGALAYTLGDGKYVGFHTEMAEKIASDLQKSLGMSAMTVKLQPVTSQNRIPLVQNGTVDLE